jgi:LysM repeat protein
MINKRTTILPIILVTILTSCSVRKTPVSSSKAYASAESYIESYKDLAISEMKRTGIPASITLAQGIIESDMGRSSLATEGNNHFGIKCHDDWKGPVVRHNDDRRNECFRKYSQPEESYRDHSDFLTKEPRYKSLFSLDVTDYKGWARGLKRAGYATNPEYANMLIRKIEEYGLNNYDRGINYTEKNINKKDIVPDKLENRIAGSPEKTIGNVNGNYAVTALRSRVSETNRIQYIIAKEGDTHESLEKEFQLLRWELAKYNELQTDFRITQGQKLYLQPKREKADVRFEFHTAEPGETMYSISQIYGIKLKNLLSMNRMTPGQEPSAGQKIWLRSMKPVDQD